MQESAERYGAADAYSAIELLDDVQQTIFTELNSKKPIDSYRRKLQKSYVEKLNKMVNTTGGGIFTITIGNGAPTTISDLSKTDIPAIARMKLMQLKTAVAAATLTTTDKMSKIHLIDLQQRIKDALEPKK